MTSKRQYERRFLNVVRACVKGFPPNEPDPNHNDKPDFIFRDQPDILGIEVTRIFHDRRANESPTEAEYAEQRLIVDSARTLCEDAGIPPLIVSVHFGAYPLLQKSDRNHLAKRIAELIGQYVPQSEDYLPLKNDCTNLDQFPEKITAIHILRLPESAIHQWRIIPAGYIGTDFRAELQQRIDKKDQLLPDYLLHCNRCWLIVAADWRNPSSFFEFSAKMQAHEFTSQFERIFFVNGFTNCAFELYIASRACSA